MYQQVGINYQAKCIYCNRRNFRTRFNFVYFVLLAESTKFDLTGDGGDYSRCNAVAPAIQKVNCEICSGGRHLLDVVAAKW